MERLLSGPERVLFDVKDEVCRYTFCDAAVRSPLSAWICESIRITHSALAVIPTGWTSLWRIGYSNAWRVLLVGCQCLSRELKLGLLLVVCSSSCFIDRPQMRSPG